MATIPSPGIGSNLDVNGIVSKLMSVESRPLLLMQQKEAKYQAKLSAYGALNSALSTFQSAVSPLALSSKFQAFNASPADASIFSASASSNAATGSYNVTVSTIAAAQSLNSTGQSSTTAAIGSGTSTTLTFQFGTISGGTLTNGVYSNASFTQNASAATGTVTIDSTNNSLQGIRDAINAANIGVTASIVHDGSSTNPYHIQLTSKSTGLAQSMKIISDGGDASVTSLLAYDPTGTQNLTQTTAAANAALTVNGQTVTSASNAVSGAIQGVTLNLIKAGTTSVNVTNDTASVMGAIQGLVNSYNEVNKTVSGLTRYDTATKTAGILFGDAPTQMIQSRLRGMLGTALSGPGSNTLQNISQVGLSFKKDGSLSLDLQKLSSALQTNFSEFAQLFSAFGKATDSLISYNNSSGNTKPGTYPITVSALATQGKTVGADKATQSVQTGSAPANLTINAGMNDALTLAVDGGDPVNVTLTAGSYTAATLAAEVQSQINAALTADGQSSQVTVSQSGGAISIKSNRFGAASDIGTVTGNGAGDLLGTPTTSRVTTITAGANDTLSMTINGTTATVTLSPGTYTPATLIAQVQSAINGTSAFAAAGYTVSVTQSADVLTVTADRYGSASTVDITGGNAITNLFGTSPTATAGTDAAGTINGVAATGSGQFLTGLTGLYGTSVGSDKGTQAVRTGSSAAGLTINAGSNDSITLAVDGGAAVTATLTAGSYTADTLATEVQTRINAALTADGQTAQVTVTQTNGILSIVSNKFGSASSVGGVSGNGATNLLGSTQSNSTQSIITAGVNDTLTLSVDGYSTTVTLVAGTYTPSTLASHIQSSINSSSAMVAVNKSVTVTQAGEIFTIASNTSGTGSVVSLTGGSARSNLFGATQAETVGAAESNAAGDLRVQVSGGALGARGSINYSQGYAYNMNIFLNSALGSSGAIESSKAGANNNISALQKQQEALRVRLAVIEKRMRAQFTALDQTIGKMASTSNFLTQQLANLPKISE